MPQGKLFIFIGIFFILLGIFFTLSGKFPIIGNLPGDIKIEKENFSFHFPLMSSIILSVLLSLIVWILNR